MSAIAYPARRGPSTRVLLTLVVGVGLVILLVAALGLPRSAPSPLDQVRPATNAEPANVAAPDAPAAVPRDQLPAGGPALPDQAAERARGILRTGTIPAGALGAESVDSGDGDVVCGTKECEP